MANRDKFRNRAAACEAHDDIPRSPENGEMIGDVILRRYNRREMMRGTLGVAAIVTLFGPQGVPGSNPGGLTNKIKGLTQHEPRGEAEKVAV
jgi:hypothetical protein